MSLKPKKRKQKKKDKWNSDQFDLGVPTSVLEYSKDSGDSPRKLFGNDVEKKRINHVLTMYYPKFRVKTYNDFQFYRGMPYRIPLDGKKIGETYIMSHMETGRKNGIDCFVEIWSPTGIGKRNIHYVTRKPMSKSEAKKFMEKIEKELEKIK